MGLDRALVDLLDAVRRKRNLSNYDRAGTTSDTEAAEVYDLAVRVHENVLDWMGKEHPDLLP